VNAVDERIIEYGFRYLRRRFPILQLEKEENVRNAASDLMFIGKFAEPVERDAVRIDGNAVKR
jgi:hypothetical protein